MDQVAARTFAEQTQLASLELGLDANDFAGFVRWRLQLHVHEHDSWRGPTTPLPMEYNPRVVFERLFGDGGTTDPAARLARIKKDRNILDSVPKGSCGSSAASARAIDRSSQEYLEAVRDVERRIQKAEQQSDRELPAVDQPAGIPATYEEHAKLMFDLAGAGVSVRPDPRHHVHDGARAQRPRISADRRRRTRIIRFRTIRTIRRGWRASRRSMRTTSGCSRITSRSCGRRPTATARCWTT